MANAKKNAPSKQLELPPPVAMDDDDMDVSEDEEGLYYFMIH
jgi:hypothetical protein